MINTQFGSRHYFLSIMQATKPDTWPIFLNASGTAVAEETSAKGYYTFMEDRRLLRQLGDGGSHITEATYILPSGKRYRITTTAKFPTPYLFNVEQNIGTTLGDAKTGNAALVAYRKLSGAALTDFIFTEAYAFSDGLALAGKKNEYGEIEYGYIDTL